MKRFSQTGCQLITVKQPRIISAYNASVGGVDSLDNFVSAYRISVKAKNGLAVLRELHYIDILSHQRLARIHRVIHGNNMSQLLDFRRRVTLALLSSEDSGGTHGGGDGRENPLTGYPKSKLLNSGHIVVHNDEMRRISLSLVHE